MLIVKVFPHKFVLDSRQVPDPSVIKGINQIILLQIHSPVLLFAVGVVSIYIGWVPPEDTTRFGRVVLESDFNEHIPVILGSANIGNNCFAPYL
jgi:hypothetical protein